MLPDQVAAIARAGLDERALRIELLAALRDRIACDAYVWLLTDPETAVGSSPLADVPTGADLPALVRLRYTSPVPRWTSVPAHEPVMLADSADRGGPSESMLPALAARFGVSDVLTVVFRDRFGWWGFLDLWRRSGRFAAADVAVLGAVSPAITNAVRTSLLAAFVGPPSPPPPLDGPAVLLLDDDLETVAQTPATERYLAALLPSAPDRRPIPAAAYNVGGQLLAVEQGIDAHPPWARVAVGGGRWLTLRAARITGGGPPASIAVTIETTASHERLGLYSRVAGLTAREDGVLRALADGSDTRAVARQLGVTEHTVQDHLKAVFAKTGSPTRRVLVARATGTG